PFPATQPAAPVITGNLEPASRWLRLAAHIIDSLIGAVFLGPGIAIMFITGAFANPDAPNPAMMMAAFGALAIGGLLLLGIQIYLLSTRGQTMGKMAVGVKIVNFEDEQNPGFVKAFLLRLFVNGLIGAVPFLGMIYSLVDICFIFRDDRRCIHDLIAGTKVVKA
ncbi:MAG TPA: RDD family protein, partial [Lacunisphaera sp.]|nr:RDD family protein [Lacunisphaera sp.]